MKEENIIVDYVLTADDIADHGGKIITTDQPLTIISDSVLISGEVPRLTNYEQGIPGELRKIDGQWHEDSRVMDEINISIQLQDKGLCLFTGCSHTGVVNAANYTQQLTKSDSIFSIMGGFHLAGPSVAERIAPTIEDLQKINPQYLITGHCTGMDMQIELNKTFAESTYSLWGSDCF